MQTQQWRSYEDIVRFEARRMGPVYGLDREDVEQELRLVAVHCAGRVRDNTGRSYVRRALRNRLANLQREANAGSRRLRDGRGRLAHLLPVEYLSPDGEIVERPLPSHGPSPDERAEAIRMMRLLRGLSERDQRILYRAFVDCVRVDDVALERARRRAEAILTGAVGRVERYPQEISTMGQEPELPLCHTHGTEPVGYEFEDPANAAECRDCHQKQSCLPEGLRSGLIKGIDLSVDQEVKAVHHGLLTVVEMRARIAQREALREAKQAVPADLEHDDVGEELQTRLNALPDKVDVRAAGDEDAEPEEDEPEPEDDVEDEPEEEEIEVEVDEEPVAVKAKPAKAPRAKKPTKLPKAPGPSSPARSKVSKSVPPAAVEPVKAKAEPKAVRALAKVTKPEKAKKAPKVKAAATPSKPAKKLTKPAANRLGEKGSFRYPGKARVLKDGGIKLPNGRTVAPPRALTPEEMGIALERTNTKLGLPFDLVPGMTLVHERRDGEPFEVKITKQGFEWDGNPYASLSGAAMACFRRWVSGIALFDFTNNNKICVKGKGVPGGMFRRSSVEGQAAAE